VVLFYFHEMDIPDAARSLGLAEGTMKARLFRARRILRAKLTRKLAELKPKEVR
jgi:RNA polymerase sigma-70 factor (ECF subfamily)